MGSLADVEHNWQIFARTDPMWSVLMDPEKRGGAWDAGEFFATGEAEVDTVLDHLKRIGLQLDFSGVALDFGCGVGRLTQALARRFASASGVDISSSMVELANKLNQQRDRCRYVVNTNDRLTAFEPGMFEFIYTSIVLQHMEPQFAIGYLREFARLLRPGGALVFQVPDRFKAGSSPRERLVVFGSRLKWTLAIPTRARRLLRRARLLRRPPGINEALAEMHCIPEQVVRQTLQANGLRVSDVQLTNSADLEFVGGLRYLEREPSVGYVSKQYCAVKPA